MPRYGLGCTVKGFDDEVVRWIDAEVHRDLTGEEPAGNEYVLTGGERSMADVEVCTKQFVTAILFRHPVHRLASNLRFLLLHFKTFMDKQARAANRTTAFYRTYANANASFWQRIAPAMTNNYYIRDLLGENVWHDPVGSLTATHHLPAARLVLMQYDIVVPMEAPKEVASRVLEYGAGWPLSYKDQVHEMKISALSERYEFDPTPFMPSYEEMSYLHRQQALDMELYEFAVLIGQLDYLVYETAAAWSVVPWEGMPATIDSNDTAAASFQVSCGLLRGPGGAWA
ncbi:hypothetical protein PLESTM_001873100 [Pleodorina starrii]|nr:hypothetical protein PLESTM_001873100 [Pleodorina starrii]